MDPFKAAGTAQDLFSRVDWGAVFDRAIKLKRRAAQYSSAHVVSALNAAMPPDRELWTPQSLGAFIAAFANVVEDDTAENGVRVVQLRSPDDIVVLLLRGTTLDPEDRSALESMLREECVEVFDILHHVHKYVREERPDIDAGIASASEEPATHPSAVRLFPPFIPVVGLAVLAANKVGGLLGSASASVAAKRRRLLERQLASIHAEALINGGLSTHECRDILGLHGLSDKDIDDALASGVNRDGSSGKPS